MLPFPTGRLGSIKLIGSAAVTFCKLGAMSASRRVTLITGRDMPGPDTETPLIAEALRSLGVESEVAVWRDSRDWRNSGLIMLRTPWDYPDHLDEFLDNHGGTIHPYEPSAMEIAVASAALACAPSQTIYARVDLAYVDEVPVVMELELIEPELFLRFSPPATSALARALKAELYK
jgi:hypothetical protein